MRALTLLLLSLFLLAAPASAQSLYGPGGLFLHPTASLPPKGQWTPSFLFLPTHQPIDDDTRIWLSSSLDYGVTDNLEVGAIFLKVTGWDHDASVGGFFKYRLLSETANRLAIAFGFTGLTGGDVNAQIGFLALRKQYEAGRYPLAAHMDVQYSG